MRLGPVASIVVAAFLTFVVCMCFIPDHDSKARHIDNGLVTNLALLSRKVKPLVKDAVIVYPPPKLTFRIFYTSNPAHETSPHAYSLSIIVSCRAPPAYHEFQLPT